VGNAMKYQQAQNSATTDYLTGLPNARSLFLHLHAELARCDRTNTSLAVLVCDLNGFKQVNDRYGHLQGNKLLQVFADSLRHMCREYDYVARMGGDEFVMVVPGLTKQAATDRAAEISHLAFEAGRRVCGDKRLSASVGAAFYAEDGRDAEQLLAVADRFMYAVKQVHHERAPKPTMAELYMLSNSSATNETRIFKVGHIGRDQDDRTGPGISSDEKQLNASVGG
jgi:diguanylate cyclase (GGDEF)-like protein